MEDHHFVGSTFGIMLINKLGNWEPRPLYCSKIVLLWFLSGNHRQTASEGSHILSTEPPLHRDYDLSKKQSTLFSLLYNCGLEVAASCCKVFSHNLRKIHSHMMTLTA